MGVRRTAAPLRKIGSLPERRPEAPPSGWDEGDLRAIFENSLDGIMLTSPDGTIHAANPAACRMLGRTEEEIRRLGREGLVDNTDPRVASLLKERARTGKARGEFFLLRPDGSRFPVAMTTSIFRDARGNLRTSLIFRDITELKEAGAALRENEERYRRIVETASEGIWTTDAEGRTTFVNRVVTGMLGYTPDEVLGRSPLDFVPEEGREAAGTFRERHRAGIPQQVEMRLRRKDGREIQVLISLTPFRDAQGRYAGGLGMITDVTRLRKLEERYRVAQRLEAVGRLAGGIAHEFNNLMTVVTGYSEILLSLLPPDAPGRGELVRIRRAGERAATLTRQLLAFGRRQVMRPRSVDLNETVAQLTPVLGPLLGESVRLEVRLSPGLPKVRVDPGQVGRAIADLAVNAREAMPGGGTLTLETADVVVDEKEAELVPELAPGRYVLLSVSDTGAGIDPEARERLFEPFTAAPETGKETRLALAAAYGIIRQSGGHVAVRSRVGRGTTFRVYLPCADGSECAGDCPAVLVVEGDEGVRELARTILEENGCRVLAAGTGEEALALCDVPGCPVRLLLAEVDAPGMSGPELAAILTGRHPGLKVLLMSGRPEEAIRGEATGAGATFLRKPFSPDDLARKVRALLEGDGPSPSGSA